MRGKMFAFRHKISGKILGFDIHTNGDVYALCEDSEQPYVLNSEKEVQHVLNSKSAGWLDSSYFNPEKKEVNLKDYEVVELLPK